MNKLRTKHHNFDLHGDFEKIKSIFAETAYDAKGKAGQVLTQSIDDVKDKSAEVRDTVADYAAEKPFKSLAIAGVVGFLIGVWWRRK